MWPLLLILLVLPGISLAMLRPKLADYVVNYVQYQGTTVIEQSIAACTSQMDGIGALQTDEAGTVTSFTTDTASVNALRTQVVQQVYNNIGALETASTSVPLGTLIDPQYLAGIGPAIPFGVTALGYVTAQVTSDFSSAGINQTRHQITLTVTADFQVHLLGSSRTVTVSADYPLSETVIVGEVPLISDDS